MFVLERSRVASIKRRSFLGGEGKPDNHIKNDGYDVKCESERELSTCDLQQSSRVEIGNPQPSPSFTQHCSDCRFRQSESLPPHRIQCKREKGEWLEFESSERRTSNGRRCPVLARTRQQTGHQSQSPAHQVYKGTKAQHRRWSASAHSLKEVSLRHDKCLRRH
jgi:hypothetical protein